MTIEKQPGNERAETLFQDGLRALSLRRLETAAWPFLAGDQIACQHRDRLVSMRFFRQRRD